MSTLVVEQWEVCHGTDSSDPSPTVVSSGFTTKRAAATLRDQMDAAQVAGQLDTSVYPTNKVFYVRAKSGEQTITVTASTPLAIIAELGAAEVSPTLYMKIDGSTVVAWSPPLSLIRANLPSG